MSDPHRVFPFFWTSKENKTGCPSHSVKGGSWAGRQLYQEHKKETMEITYRPIDCSNLGDEPFTR